MSGFDQSVVVSGHVRWQLLTADEQSDLEANYPRHPTINPPGTDVFGDDVDPRFEAWLDQSYTLRHWTDVTSDDFQL